MRIKVKVIAGRRKTEMRGVMSDGTQRIAVAAPPEKGKANAALVRYLAAKHGCVRDAVKIISGKTSTRKVIEIVDN